MIHVSEQPISKVHDNNELLKVPIGLQVTAVDVGIVDPVLPRKHNGQTTTTSAQCLSWAPHMSQHSRAVTDEGAPPGSPV